VPKFIEQSKKKMRDFKISYEREGIIFEAGEELKDKGEDGVYYNHQDRTKNIGE